MLSLASYIPVQIDLESTPNMNRLDQVPVLILHVLEADIPQNTSIVYEDIDAPEAVDSGLDDGFAILDAVVVCYGLSALGTDLVDDGISGL